MTRAEELTKAIRWAILHLEQVPTGDTQTDDHVQQATFYLLDALGETQ